MDELIKRRMRCIARRTIWQDERIDMCVRFAVASFVLSLLAVILAMVG